MDGWINIRSLCKSYGTLPVIDHWNLQIKQGERLVLLGPSGCGKTTFLKIISGLEKPGSGSIEHLPLKIGFAFQSSRLIPWHSVKNNLLFVNENGDYQEILARLGLAGFEDYLPSQLSGGMRQRVNLARALITRPDLLILDEAFRSLDWGVKTRIINDINQLWQKETFTLIAVTHDPREAFLLADRVIILSSRPARILKEIDLGAAKNMGPMSTSYLQFESDFMKLLPEMEVE
jgi:NitT/TauT family transport system ATP-binding protein